jgi:serine/threonine protein kinase
VPERVIGKNAESTCQHASIERSAGGRDVTTGVSAACSPLPALDAEPNGASAPSGFPAPGCVLEGKYRLVAPVAIGSMGSVWRAQHLALDAPVAIKLMQPGADSDVDVRRRFLREARIASAVRSPHVVQVLDYGVERDVPYIVMEFLRGESLAQRLRRVGRLSPAQTADILVPLAQALQRAHALGVVHRDIKPENIFIVQDGERELTKLLDFGVAKVRERKFGVSVSRDTAEGEMVGTPHYMSPEQARGATTVDHRTDVWALGVIAFECLLGYPPFVASGLASLLMQICAQPLPVPSARAPVPVGFDAWFARACARTLEERFSTVVEATRQLGGLCAVGRLTTPPLLGSPGAWRWIWRHCVHGARAIRARKVWGLPPRWWLVLVVASLLGGAATGAARRGVETSRAASLSPGLIQPGAMSPVTEGGTGKPR